MIILIIIPMILLPFTILFTNLKYKWRWFYSALFGYFTLYSIFSLPKYVGILCIMIFITLLFISYIWESSK